MSNLPPYVRTKNGRYYYVRKVDGRMRWKSLTRVSEGDAALWQMYERECIGKPDTVNDLMTSYRAADDGMLALREKTQTEYVAAMTRHLEPNFGKASPEAVTQKRVAMFLDSMGNVAANRAVATLSSVFSWAMRKGHVDVNPCHGVRRNTERPRTRYVSDEELKDALDRSTFTFRRFLWAAYLTGLRQGDLRRMKNSQVTKDGLLVTEAKKGKRILVEWSDTLRDSIEAAQIYAKSRKPTHDYLFVNEFGNPWTQSAVSSAMRRLKVDFTFHDIRAKAESDHATGLGLLSRYKRARRVTPVYHSSERGGETKG